MLREFHDLHFHVVLHVVNPPENLHGNADDTGTAAAVPGDAANYWRQHVPLVKLGVDGWWPDEGDVLPVASRLVRNRMYWEGGCMDDAHAAGRSRCIGTATRGSSAGGVAGAGPATRLRRGRRWRRRS